MLANLIFFSNFKILSETEKRFLLIFSYLYMVEKILFRGQIFETEILDELILLKNGQRVDFRQLKQSSFHVYKI